MTCPQDEVPPTNSSDLQSAQDNGPNSSHLTDAKDCIYLLFSQEMHRNTASGALGGLSHNYDWMIQAVIKSVYTVQFNSHASSNHLEYIFLSYIT